jgi:hypothetical protein
MILRLLESGAALRLMHAPVKSDCLHPAFLELLIEPAGAGDVVPAGLASGMYEKHAVVGTKAMEERVHTPGARQVVFFENVETTLSIGWIGGDWRERLDPVTFFLRGVAYGGRDGVYVTARDAFQRHDPVSTAEDVVECLLLPLAQVRVSTVDEDTCAMACQWIFAPLPPLHDPDRVTLEGDHLARRDRPARNVALPVHLDELTRLDASVEVRLDRPEGHLPHRMLQGSLQHGPFVGKRVALEVPVHGERHGGMRGHARRARLDPSRARVRGMHDAPRLVAEGERQLLMAALHQEAFPPV